MSILDRIIDRRIARYQGDLLSTHYAEVENMYNQTRGWRHDYRNHIQVLKNYAELGDLEAVKTYLDGLEKDLNTVDLALKTGNRMTDIILNSKISLARSKDIQVRADAHVPVTLTASGVDLCIILGNLFDNAIEACMQLPKEERMIRIYMEMKNTQLYISLTNTTAQKKQQRQENGRFASTKGQGHGYGLVRIDTIIERYQGYIRRGSEDGAFTTEVLLPQ
ncbi:MAG: GHKL domain-containing protein [bacterium]|nr:GHKL domain-containing protein [bacterium]